MKTIYVIEYVNKEFHRVVNTSIDDLSLLSDIFNDCHEESRLAIRKISLVEKSENSETKQDGRDG